MTPRLWGWLTVVLLLAAYIGIQRAVDRREAKRKSRRALIQAALDSQPVQRVAEAMNESVLEQARRTR